MERLAYVPHCRSLYTGYSGHELDFEGYVTVTYPHHDLQYLISYRCFIGRIHGAIVDTTVGAIVACNVYTRRLSQSSVAATIAAMIATTDGLVYTLQAIVAATIACVYTRGDGRRDCRDDDRSDRLRRRSPRVYTLLLIPTQT